MHITINKKTTKKFTIIIYSQNKKGTRKFSKWLNVTIVIVIVIVVCKLKHNKIQFAIQYNTIYMVLVICVLKYNALLFIMVDLQIHKKVEYNLLKICINIQYH